MSSTCNRLDLQTLGSQPIRLCPKFFLVTGLQSPTSGAHTHAHAYGFWVGMGAMLLFMGGHGCNIIVHRWAWVGISFVHPCIQLQIGVKLLGCREYANQEALRAKANDNERPFICLIQPRLGVGM
jgi:hypothetical protein